MSLLARIPLFRSIFPPREHSLRYKDDEDRRAVIRARLLAIATVAAGLIYVIWLFFALNPHHPWMGGAFVAAEVACLLLFVTASFTVWRLRYKPLEGLALGQAPSVDIFVTACGEPLAVVQRTLRAASAIEWPGSGRSTCWMMATPNRSKPKRWRTGSFIDRADGVMCRSRAPKPGT